MRNFIAIYYIASLHESFWIDRNTQFSVLDGSIVLLCVPPRVVKTAVEYNRVIIDSIFQYTDETKCSYLMHSLIERVNLL